MIALVGNTGFVGSNIMKHGKIDAAYHSRNITEAYGTHPDLLIYAGLRAEKYLANQDPQKDRESILAAENNIIQIGPKKLVLISTIDVYPQPYDVDETWEIDPKTLEPYGAHRYELEQWVRKHYPDALIIRLPGLFGDNIKKNFIYDFIHYIPFMLKEVKMEELSAKEPDLKNFYTLQNNGFYRCTATSKEEKQRLKAMFQKVGFSALCFTDSRSIYQFYPLERLWDDICMALEQELRVWNPATEPVSAAEVYHYLTATEFVNEISPAPAFYDYRTVHSAVFGGEQGYIMNKQEVLRAIRQFVEEQSV
ncbi:MAG: NAD(P)-dependent oxidoreductase [Lachnospiraceae bacterium]|nr:NAD(P)-dependent oxidoreductase [Lachnospiraceae bacterium]